jgi:hypothetical protein
MIEPGQLLQIPQKKCNRTQLFEVVSVALQLEVRYPFRIYKWRP